MRYNELDTICKKKTLALLYCYTNICTIHNEYVFLNIFDPEVESLTTCACEGVLF